jgi:hypothetical protein
MVIRQEAELPLLSFHTTGRAVQHPVCSRRSLRLIQAVGRFQCLSAAGQLEMRRPAAQQWIESLYGM